MWFRKKGTVFADVLFGVFSILDNIMSMYMIDVYHKQMNKVTISIKGVSINAITA